MKHEAPSAKWDRLKGQVQQGILNGYPNTQREGCPGAEAIAALAVRSSNIDDEAIEDDPRWEHVTHCSPCYGEYLVQFDKVRDAKHAAALK
jgi:hypothetical protein